MRLEAIEIFSLIIDDGNSSGAVVGEKLHEMVVPRVEREMELPWLFVVLLNCCKLLPFFISVCRGMYRRNENGRRSAGASLNRQNYTGQRPFRMILHGGRAILNTLQFV